MSGRRISPSNRGAAYVASRKAGGAGGVWRGLAFALAALLVASLLAGFADARIAALVRPGAERTAIDGALALVWLALAWAIVVGGRRRLALERDARALDERRAWNLAVNLFAALGYAYVLLVAVALLRIDLSGILVGGAVTGVVLGIAAQSALGNLFGGMLVLLLHPYSAGQRIMVRSSNFGGVEYTGTVREVTLFYTILASAGGQLVIPNSLAVASVVRVEAAESRPSALVPVAYRVSLEELEAALRAAGIEDPPQVEAYGPDAYSARVHLPAEGGDRALLAVMRSLTDRAP
jgi:small conductance mechanosensitive channel